VVKQLGMWVVAGGLLFISTTRAQRMTEGSQGITIQVLDGRNGKPLADQRVLVFTGLSNSAVKNHAADTEVTTDKYGIGTLTIYPAETQWLQVFADGRTLCYPDPNDSSFSVSDIISKGLATPNDCSKLVRESSPGHFIIFARPARFMEKMRR
jgi:hypothetical protein